jgi:hypothetical protein
VAPCELRAQFMAGRAVAPVVGGGGGGAAALATDATATATAACSSSAQSKPGAASAAAAPCHDGLPTRPGAARTAPPCRSALALGGMPPCARRGCTSTCRTRSGRRRAARSLAPAGTLTPHGRNSLSARRGGTHKRRTAASTQVAPVRAHSDARDAASATRCRRRGERATAPRALAQLRERAGGPPARTVRTYASHTRGSALAAAAPRLGAALAPPRRQRR